jgi:hypothetical protein
VAIHPVVLTMLALELILCMGVATGSLRALLAAQGPSESQRQ